MPRFFTLVFFFLLLGKTAFATIDISLTNPASQTLVVSYKANSSYSTAPFNIWNSQVFTMRWSTALGANVITGITNQSAFTFTLEGSPMNGSDGFFYQKLTAAATNVNQSIANGATLAVLQINLFNANICGGDFELITGTNIVNSIFGTASANNVLGEQFHDFTPAIVETALLNPSSNLVTWYADTDNDGKGNPAVSQVDCAQPTGFVANQLDCNDTNPNLPTTPGTSCNDGDPNTSNDVILANGCGCAGIPVNCPTLGLNFGASCDDGNPNTTGTTVQPDCSCGGGTTNPCTGSGDADGDGVCTGIDCNDNDPQATGIIGASCNDGNTCTVNDKVTAGCGCVGTVQDSDNDGICDANDVCPNGPNPGSPCVDTNPNTIGTTIQSDCNCGGGTTTSLTLTCPPNISVTTQPGQSNSIVSYNPPTVNTNCTAGNVNISLASGLASGASFPLGATTVTYSATNGCGNNQSCSFQIIVNVGQGSLDCNNVNIVGGNDNTITVSGLVAPVNEVQVIKNDWSSNVYTCLGNCNVPTQQVANLFAGTYHVLVKFYDAGYHLICQRTQDVVVQGSNNTALSLTCPGNITIAMPSGQTGVVVNYPAPVASTNCPNSNATVQFMAGLQSGAAFPLGTTVVTYKATDACTNTATCSFSVAVNPIQANLDCNAIQFNVLDDSIIVSGLVAPVNEVQVISGDWSNKLYSCLGNCNSPVQVISQLDPGLYHILVKFYTANYQLICERYQDAIISSGASHLISFDLLNTVLDGKANVDLTWVNNSQAINDYFLVERSANGVDFELLTQLDASADVSKMSLYRDVDKNPIEGDNYYRIKLVFKDGSYSYTDIRMVSFNPESCFTIMPNPASDEVRLYLDCFLGKEDVTILISNTLGQVLYQEGLDIVSDKILPIQLERAKFPDGVYIVSVVRRGRAQSKRLVIARF